MVEPTGSATGKAEPWAGSAESDTSRETISAKRT